MVAEDERAGNVYYSRVRSVSPVRYCRIYTVQHFGVHVTTNSRSRRDSVRSAENVRVKTDSLRRVHKVG